MNEERLRDAKKEWQRLVRLFPGEEALICDTSWTDEAVALMHATMLPECGEFLLEKNLVPASVVFMVYTKAMGAVAVERGRNSWIFWRDSRIVAQEAAERTIEDMFAEDAEAKWNQRRDVLSSIKPFTVDFGQETSQMFARLMNSLFPFPMVRSSI